MPISTTKLAEEMGSSYILALTAAKRAKQLKEGAPQLVESESNQSITIALEEIHQGKIRAVMHAVEAVEAVETDILASEDIPIDAGLALPALDPEAEEAVSPASLSALLGDDEEEEHEDEDEEISADLSVLDVDAAGAEVIDEIELEDDEEDEETPEEASEISLEDVAEEEEAMAEEDEADAE